jgi:hypothetical protein
MQNSYLRILFLGDIVGTTLLRQGPVHPEFSRDVGQAGWEL